MKSSVDLSSPKLYNAQELYLALDSVMPAPRGVKRTEANLRTWVRMAQQTYELITPDEAILLLAHLKLGWKCAFCNDPQPHVHS